MHYQGTFKDDQNREVIIMKDRKTGASIGVNKELSLLDIKKLNKMYPCQTVNPTCGEF